MSPEFSEMLLHAGSSTPAVIARSDLVVQAGLNDVPLRHLSHDSCSPLCLLRLRDAQCRAQPDNRGENPDFFHWTASLLLVELSAVYHDFTRLSSTRLVISLAAIHRH